MDQAAQHTPDKWIVNGAAGLFAATATSTDATDAYLHGRSSRLRNTVHAEVQRRFRWSGSSPWPAAEMLEPGDLVDAFGNAGNLIRPDARHIHSPVIGTVDGVGGPEFKHLRRGEWQH